MLDRDASVYSCGVGPAGGGPQFGDRAPIRARDRAVISVARAVQMRERRALLHRRAGSFS
jgi:hypothetical protein